MLHVIQHYTEDPSQYNNIRIRNKKYTDWKDTDVENGPEDMGRGKGKLRRSERVALTYIHYQM